MRGNLAAPPACRDAGLLQPQRAAVRLRSTQGRLLRAAEVLQRPGRQPKVIAARRPNRAQHRCRLPDYDAFLTESPERCPLGTTPGRGDRSAVFISPPT
jgi:hypothetical protein